MSSRWFGMFAGSGLALTLLTPMAAQCGESPAPLAALFDDDILADNTWETLNQTRTLPDAVRYETLKHWVFPAFSHGTLRVTGAFSRAGEEPLHNVHSPVFDLLDLAEKTGQLRELADHLDRLDSHAASHSESQNRSYWAMRSLVGLAMNDAEIAGEALQRLMELVRTAPQTVARDQWPELLVACRGLQRHASHDSVPELINLLNERQSQRPPTLDEGAVRGLVCSLIGQVRWQADAVGPAASHRETELQEWIPATGSSAWSRGSGYAPLVWRRNSRNEIQHVSGHSDDLLLYQSPLRGDFEITGDVSGHGQTQLMLSGQILGAIDGTQRAAGTFRSGGIANLVQPPLLWHSPWVRFRAQFTGDQCRLTLNGRQVSEYSVSHERDPWIGFHSRWWTSAAVRHVQIVGSPQIPKSVMLSTSPSLEGWKAYGRQSVGFESADWQCDQDAAGHNQITGRRATELDGTHVESLLRYVRPLRSGDAIEYDFFLDASTGPTHPTLGTTAFIIQPEGIMLHEVTDSEYDQTELPPDNLSVPTGESLGRVSVPLKSNAWNRLRLERDGELAKLSLNGKDVLHHHMGKSAHLPFGLFYFADRTQAQVRDVVLHGGWPTELPSLPEQTLADLTVSQIDDRLPALTASFSHSFVQEGLHSPLLQFARAQQMFLDPQPVGVVAHSKSAGPWLPVELSVSAELHGDIEVEAEFADFERSGAGWAGILLNLEFDDPARHLTRTMLLKDPAGQGPMLQASLSEEKNGERIYDHFDLIDCDSTSGRLRVSRRGEIVHSLFAEGDSPTFRSIGQRKVSTSPTKTGRIVLQALSHAGSQCRVTWKSLTMRAEHIVEHPAAPVYTLEELDRSRSRLPAVLEYDFATEGLKPERFVTWNVDPNGITQTPKGLKVSKTAAGDWSFTTLLSKSLYSGDFDIEVAFEEARLSGQEHACILLAADLSDAEQSSYRIVRMRDDQQRETVFSQLQRMTKQGVIHDSLDGFPAEAGQGRLRIARRGRDICFLFAEADGPYRLVNQQRGSDVASNELGVKLECLANGTATSSVVWKSLSLRADKVD